ncbi:TPA: acyl-CoA thioesterase [Campylobacter lari]|uniref:Acyl-CoA hydrolase n=3 Tax=Campylobacter TaxID=194 RepID=B9KDE9_CAMLR|nr:MULTISPECIES: acyl-CoA thioesterase [Campylobacter]MCR8676822.1 acyl-CoA thioesterase [Campylobacter sp. S4:11]MCR8705606.1 acyl-CoA thioesterase [Campylobacter sp. 2352 PW]ACM64588.1 acyl-CoA hydrolase [Campylobacter lari RM2100]AJC89623.1 acyl-CoA hydrolase [Campylobacter lari subsp. concheus LMG 11760]AJC91279.1 acyl-CoA hydrolase [Campylobacter subantarcticus LMG 24374]
MKDMGEPKLRVIAMPSNTNPAGNIFGGWIMSQIDLAGAIAARELSPQRVVTVAVDKIIFKEPIFVGDLVSCYAKIIKAGNTSITVAVEVVTQRANEYGRVYCMHVTSAVVTYVSVDKDGNKFPIDADLKRLHGF